MAGINPSSPGGAGDPWRTDTPAPADNPQEGAGQPPAESPEQAAARQQDARNMARHRPGEHSYRHHASTQGASGTGRPGSRMGHHGRTSSDDIPIGLNVFARPRNAAHASRRHDGPPPTTRGFDAIHRELPMRPATVAPGVQPEHRAAAAPQPDAIAQAAGSMPRPPSRGHTTSARPEQQRPSVPTRSKTVAPEKQKSRAGDSKNSSFLMRLLGRHIEEDARKKEKGKGKGKEVERGARAGGSRHAGTSQPVVNVKEVRAQTLNWLVGQIEAGEIPVSTGLQAFLDSGHPMKFRVGERIFLDLPEDEFWNQLQAWSDEDSYVETNRSYVYNNGSPALQRAFNTVGSPFFSTAVQDELLRRPPAEFQTLAARISANFEILRGTAPGLSAFITNARQGQLLQLPGEELASTLARWAENYRELFHRNFLGVGSITENWGNDYIIDSLIDWPREDVTAWIRQQEIARSENDIRSSDIYAMNRHLTRGVWRARLLELSRDDLLATLGRWSVHYGALLDRQFFTRRGAGANLTAEQVADLIDLPADDFWEQVNALEEQAYAAQRETRTGRRH